MTRTAERPIQVGEIQRVAKISLFAEAFLIKMAKKKEKKVKKIKKVGLNPDDFPEVSDYVRAVKAEKEKKAK